MELSFSELRAKEVINIQDGRKLGKVIDVALRYPENRWCGIVVPGSRGFGFKKNELFIELRNITKIGEDVILVNIGLPQQKRGEKRGNACPPSPPHRPEPFEPMSVRNYEEFE